MKHIAFRIKLQGKAVAAYALVVFALLAVLVSFVSFSQKAQAATGIYKTLNFQGKVVNTNGTNVADATYTFRFRIYTSSSGDTGSPCLSTCTWEETKSLTTVNGIFQTNLGDTTTLPGSVNFNTDTQYVSVLFNGDTEMAPRIRLTSVPYAFNSDMLDGLDSSALVQLTPAAQQSGTINVSGNITSAASVAAAGFDANTATALQIGGSNATSITLAKNTNMSGSFTMSIQGNNALSLGSTTAAGGIIFKDGTVNNRAVTITTVGLTASYSLNLPSTGPSAGLQCLQTASGSTVNLAFGSCGATGGSSVSLQAGTPGTPDTGNFNISGVGIAASYQAASFDQSTSALLNIGTTTASSITIARTGFTTTVAGILTVAGNLNTQDVSVGSNKSISYVSGTGSFDQHLASGTFQTGTGAVSLNGNTTVANNKSFTAGGDALFKDATNSATAFQIQNAAGTATLLSVDTTLPTNLVSNAGFETNATGWSAKTAAGTIAPTQVTNQTPPYGSGSMQVVTSGTLVALDGIETGVTLANSTAYSFSAWVKVTSGSTSNVAMGYSLDGAAVTSCTTTGASNATNYLRVSCTFTTTASPAATGSAYVFIGFNDTAARTFHVDGVSLEQVASGAYYKEGRTSFGSAAINGPLLVQNSVNSSLAFGVISATGGNGLTVDTFNSTLTSNFATTLGSTLTVNSTGLFSTINSSAFRVRNSTTAANLVAADTTIPNNDTNGSMENSTTTATGYATIGTGSTIVVDTTANNAYMGANTLKITTTGSATTNAGTKYNLTTGTLASSTQYALSFYAKLSSGTFTTLAAGRADDGSTNTPCTLSSNTVLTTGWQRYSCTFTTGTTSGTPYFFIGQSDAGVAHVYFLDGIQIEAAASATNYREGKLQFNGDIISPSMFKNQSDSTVAFAVQNAAGASMFTVDTLNSTTSFGSNVAVTGTVSATVGLQAPLLDALTPATALAIGTTNANAINLNQSTTIAAGKNLIFASGAGVFDQSASTGTFKTGTGAVSLNGDTTIASGKTLTVNGDTTIKNTSVTAFQLQNTAGTATLFAFDTSGGNLTIGSGATRTVAVGTAAASTAGSNLNVTGGASGAGGNTNGGSLVLSGGTGTGTGVQGLVSLASTAFGASSVQTNTIAAGLVDSYSSIPVTANTTNVTISVPVPISTVTGRILYITAASGSNDFTLLLGGTSISIAMKQNSTATLIWNGTGWTAAGASSSTDLQSAYNNTLTSAGGAEVVLNPSGGNADGFTIRNNPTTPIIGPLLEVQSSIGTNLLSVNNNATEYATNGGAETSGSFATAWAAYGTTTVTRNTTLANVATGQASVQLSLGTTIDNGVKNTLSTALTAGTQYQVSFTTQLTAGTALADLTVGYSRDGTASGSTGLDLCTTYSTQAVAVSSSIWTKITCLVTPTGTVTSGNKLVIRQPTSPASGRTLYIDNLSVTVISATSTPPNVQIGGGLYGGAATVLTLDRSSSAPVANGNTTLLGSMYYDTTSGRIQCYEADGWGACGSSPDNYVNLVPEFPGAVLDGGGVGTLTADFCANQSSVLTVNSTLCSTGQALNFYKWTSPQASQQTYSVYVTYQLPAAFKQFQSDSTVQLTARTDNTTNGIVTYQMFRSESGTLAACGTETTVTSSVNTWQTVGINGNELTGCGFSNSSANNFAIFKINVKANSNANVYVGTLSFTTTGQ